MLQNPAWQMIDNLTRAQLAMFQALGDRVRLSQDGRRRALALDDSAWLAWRDFLTDDGPLPGIPALPDMLHRLATTTHQLAVAAEESGERPDDVYPAGPVAR
jgi:hypothetical protein